MCVSVSKWINEAFNKLSYDNPVAKKISYLVNIHIHTHIYIHVLQVIRDGGHSGVKWWVICDCIFNIIINVVWISDSKWLMRIMSGGQRGRWWSFNCHVPCTLIFREDFVPTRWVIRVLDGRESYPSDVGVEKRVKPADVDKNRKGKAQPICESTATSVLMTESCYKLILTGWNEEMNVARRYLIGIKVRLWPWGWRSMAKAQGEVIYLSSGSWEKREGSQAPLWMPTRNSVLSCINGLTEFRMKRLAYSLPWSQHPQRAVSGSLGTIFQGIIDHQDWVQRRVREGWWALRLSRGGKGCYA